MHGEEAFPRLRNELFRHLVEHEGYRSIAIESDCLAGLLVDGFVTDGVGSLEDVMRRGFSHGFGESPANRDLVHWMREYNRDRPAEDRLRFFGFDAPIEMTGPDSPRQALTALHTYLVAELRGGQVPHDRKAVDRLLGDDGRWTNPAAAVEPAASVGASAEAGTLRVIADDLLAALTSEAPQLVASTSSDEWWQARLYGSTAVGLLRYHAAMADDAPTRVSRLLGLRDAMMADNLTAICEHQARRGPTLVFAHNRHLQRVRSRWQLGGQPLRWWSAGAVVGARLADRYAFVAAALGAAPRHGLPAPAPDTLEGVLATLPGDRHLIDAPRLAGALGRATPLSPRTDTSTGHGYFPLDPDQLAQIDAVVFLKHLP
ncbi:erythromycin esterase [Micromonospora deserti]|uniref:Erythromycin esterase n=2 Tax=Micromonospora deserti TaxID=2070366 RepID=A0A2W2DPJ6_9ACTN|nr:erythromycin esterase [Micromonospora deserti]